jgi:hypothetical protein
VGNGGLGSSGLATGASVGSANITATYTDYKYHYFVADGSCNDYTVTKSAFGTVTVTPPIPTNFHIQSENNLNDGSLFFIYTWSSTSGNQADLASCTVGESVFYPNYPSTPYIWPLPMVASSVNPTPISGAGNNQGFSDQNFPPDRYQPPYFAIGFPATQRFWWQCPYYQNGAIQSAAPDVTITRRIFKDTDNFWKYQITKSGYTNTIKIPNQ